MNLSRLENVNVPNLLLNCPPLPAPLHFLYPLLRPIRLLSRYPTGLFPRRPATGEHGDRQ